MSQPKKTDRQYQQKSTPLHHNRPYISESAFSIAPGSHNLRTCTKAKGYRKNSVPEAVQKFYRHHFKNSPGMIDRLVTAPLRYNEAMDKIDALEHEGKVFVIRPQKPVNVSRVEKDVDKLVALYQDGRRDMEFAYRDLMAFLQQE